MNKDKIKIIATLGPSSSSLEVIGSMIDSGMNIARLNFSWGTHEEMKKIIKNVRDASKERGVDVPILQDLSGPRLTLLHGHKIDDSIKEVITKKDINDLYFGLDNAVEYVAMSYVSSSEDIHTLKDIMIKRGQLTPIIAKIERKEALDDINAITDASYGIMIARGDLGLALPIEEVPFVERRIIDICEKKGQFVIVATEMLLSMTKEKNPTRAEVNDVATAVILGASALMLSEETARGENPIEAVKTMRKIIDFSLKEKMENGYIE